MRGERFVVTVFGSASVNRGSPEYDTAYEIGEKLASSGFIVCNGGYGGSMEASARGAKSAGGSTIGIITEFYAGKPANKWIDEMVTTKTTIDRLLRLIKEGDAYICLGGGTGTLLELSAVWEMMNKKVIPHRPFLTLGSYWKTIADLVGEQLVHEGREGARDLITCVDTPDDCVTVLIDILGVRYEA